MTVTINWTVLGSIVSALAGAAGSVITPIYGAGLATSVSAVLQGLSGLLVAIGAFHVTAVAATEAKAKVALKYERLRLAQPPSAHVPDIAA